MDFFLFEKYDILQIVLNEMSDLFPITWVDPVNKLVKKYHKVCHNYECIGS
jgi:hypothetical protein